MLRFASSCASQEKFRMFESNYAPLPPVVNSVAQLRLQNHAAPVINAGTALSNDTLAAATNQRVEREKGAQIDLVTAEEVIDARKREHGILAELTVSTYPPAGAGAAAGGGAAGVAAGAPAWFAAGLAIALRPLEDRMGNLEANRSIYQAGNNMQGFALTPLRRYFRVDDQLGDGIPGMGRLIPNRLPHGLNPVAVGQEIPSPPFPTTLQAINGMENVEINYLGMLLRTDFDIVAADNDAMIRRKVLLYFGRGG
ncbi:hypothetical protein PHYPSEUDO_009402 [Phytophthora pseudosyringae]|uniref:Uncharacterized protein n=1 Tax=Phytophthora pseudosyringae TaxID=221518 RepID=A0A8T1WAZ2_9STRA|nr:hypothetical protein PHYPSEUDO_009402 [Phytophthora pseudosyringae]